MLIFKIKTNKRACFPLQTNQWSSILSIIPLVLRIYMSRATKKVKLNLLGKTEGQGIATLKERILKFDD